MKRDLLTPERTERLLLLQALRKAWCSADGMQRVHARKVFYHERISFCRQLHEEGTNYLELKAAWRQELRRIQLHRPMIVTQERHCMTCEKLGMQRSHRGSHFPKRNRLKGLGLRLTWRGALGLEWIAQQQVSA